MRGSETVREYPFAHSSLQLHEISTYMPHETLHCKDPRLPLNNQVRKGVYHQKA